MDKYILVGKTPVLEPDLMKWGEWFERGNRLVAKTNINSEVEVSTFFLGLDHSFGNGELALFETMIFGGVNDQDCRRCATWDEAERIHEDVCHNLRVIDGE